MFNHFFFIFSELVQIYVNYFRFSMENRFLSQNMKYFAYFTLCEILNLVAILVNFHITNCFLDGKFLTYGLEVITYMNGMAQSQLVDPRCNVFPTLVSMLANCNQILFLQCLKHCFAKTCPVFEKEHLNIGYCNTMLQNISKYGVKA